MAITSDPVFNRVGNTPLHTNVNYVLTAALSCAVLFIVSSSCSKNTTMRSALLAALLLGLLVSVYAHAACQAVLDSSPSSFANGSQHADCDYVTPDQTPANETEHAIDLYWIKMVNDWARDHMPLLPFGAAIVDSRNNSLVTIGTNMFYSEDEWYSQMAISHAETVVITNATRLYMPGYFNQTSGKRRVDPNWKYMTLYGNVETCPMCAQAAIWRGIRRMVFGARQTYLYQKRCWTEPTLTAYEVVDHSRAFAPFSVVRGPMTELEDEVVNIFPNNCASQTTTTTAAASTTSAPATTTSGGTSSRDSAASTAVLSVGAVFAVMFALLM